jgi:uncharacterized protein YkwD
MRLRPRFIILIGLALCAAPRSSQAVVLLVENAESGLANVTAHTTGGYPLIQSAIVAQGANAFRLANPAFADNWFEINQPITIQADSKLFFQSRMGFVASGQVATVQMSTNGGGTWSPTLYSQTGTSDGTAVMESGFSLRTIDLSPYANQTARFRFLLDRVGNPAFTQTDPDVGWYIDNIQIADQFQKSQYSIGSPSADAQQYLEYINRARADAMVEANRLANTNDPQILSAYSQFGITPQSIVNSFQSYVNTGQIDQYAQPLAFNAALNTAAELHTQDMYNNQFQGHNSSNNPPTPFQPGYSLSQRYDAVGYEPAATGIISSRENVYSYSKSVPFGHAGFDVDWGNNPAGHRIAIHDGYLQEVGIGVVNGTNGPVGPQLVTQDFGRPDNAFAFITGVVYQDFNSNNFYDIGEGRSGVRVDVAGSPYFAISTASGGYSVPITGNGMQNVSFTGGGYASFSTTANVTGGNNFKVDYKVTAVTYAADFNDDNKVDGVDLAQWRGDFGIDNGSDANGDGRSDGRDFLIWQREFGSGVTAASVPEPSALLLGVLGVLALRRRRR